MLLAAIAPLGGQQEGPGTPRDAEIHGVVLEAETKTPVVDAEVTLHFVGEGRPRTRVAAGLLPVLEITRTDNTGAFAFHADKLGHYTVAVRKAGYRGQGQSGEGSSTEVVVTTARPKAEACLFLISSGRITGRVVDAATDKPLAGITVAVFKVRHADGLRRLDFGAGGSATTGPDGEFVSPDLVAGEYVAIIQPQRSRGARLTMNFSHYDLRIVDQDYERTYWPGGHDLVSAMPVLVGSGASVDIGTVTARKIPYYRVHLRVPVGTCRAKDTMQVYEQLPAGGLMEIAPEAQCRQDVLISGFAPGSYRLVLTMNKRTAEARETASVPFVINDENIEITAPLQRGVTVAVDFRTADGAKAPDFTKMSLALLPRGAIPVIDIASPKNADASGTVRFAGVPLVNQRVMVFGVGAGYYVKEVQYNGATITDFVLPLANGAADHSVTVLIDDKPAAVTGVVMNGDKPVGNPWVILARWPLPSGDSPYRPARVAGDDKGRFQFRDLAPAEYRIIAVRSQEEDENRAIGTLEHSLEQGQKITLGPRAFQNLTIAVCSLR